MSGIFVMMFIILTVSLVLGATRRNRPPLGGGGYPPQLDPRAPQPFGMLHGPQPPNPFLQQGHAPSFGQQGYGAGYDPAAQQPISETSRRAIDEDITRFGDELRDLDLDVVGRELDEATQADYTQALDAYDGAKQQLSRARSNADVRTIAEIMEGGRYSVACVRARVNGRPVPERRPPCFFDPAHGVSVADVSWAPPGGAPRQVPACAADASRIRTGHDPSIRMVYAGPQGAMVPYWDHRDYAPLAQGYYGRFGGDPALRSITNGALMIGGFALLMGLLDD
ncbi:MAG: hypothetical protein IPJ61_11420 [Tessaracoccus sp.]|uniref:hypothetical protein n=1 Tax=Tessaracoccus sp. TaxID=1971211 RepID=UPI001EC0C34B|nr:hypothetical protein [Tessaracoccus sp.]MBK7821652.1 hypothetical protein [Tessaracoccus sp.]